MRNVRIPVMLLLGVSVLWALVGPTEVAADRDGDKKSPLWTIAIRVTRPDESARPAARACRSSSSQMSDGAHPSGSERWSVYEEKRVR
jgi:hypothetical protein